MSISAEKKKEFVVKYGKGENDSGAPAVQIAIMTERIRNLTSHLQSHKKDFGTRRGLLQLIGRRRRLQSYLQRNNPDEYAELIKSLELRR